MEGIYTLEATTWVKIQNREFSQIGRIATVTTRPHYNRPKVITFMMLFPLREAVRKCLGCALSFQHGAQRQVVCAMPAGAEPAACQ
jgi:hypothetical protein